jgi:hypothetical protein
LQLQLLVLPLGVQIFFSLFGNEASMPGGLHPPLSVISSWRPNYTHPETRGWGIVVLVSVLLALCYVVVFMRIWARLRLAKNSGLDDALIVFNLVSSPFFALDIQKLSLIVIGSSHGLSSISEFRFVLGPTITMTGHY